MSKVQDEKEAITNETKSVDTIVYPEIEPGIISKQMIENAYLDEGYKGEEDRLHRIEPVVYERITSLRLDFKNILRIDHLWILPNLTKLALNCNKIETIEHLDTLVNLKELDLSFNFIERIENLDKLVNLEVLSLFSNLIVKIENLDALQKIIILSIGNNLINSIEGIERFRFLPNLKILNLEGNPVGNEADFSLSDYVAAILPKLKYYEYVAINEDQRKKARSRFSRELREIETNEEMELQVRSQKLKEEQDAEQLSLSFVEHLNEHQLFESLWIDDEDGRILMLVGEAANNLAEEYDNDIFELTQEIYKLGLKKYEERQREIELFQRSISQGHLQVQQTGHKILEDFMIQKNMLFDEAIACHKYLEKSSIQVDTIDDKEAAQYVDKLENISMQFDDMVNSVWQQLMSQELHLHEATENTTINFERKMQEMIEKFMEQVRTFFSQLRDIAVQFSENLYEIVSRFIANKLAMQDFDGVPEPLRICMEDRKAISNLVYGMKDVHTQRIDKRKDRLIQRSKQFIDDMISKLKKNELERNRTKVLEINAFLDLITESWHNLQQEVHDKLLNIDN
ncbi:dynein regulatory complex subunit 3 [Stomoxys calcitrans]|uniref:dynein regulatory complex subunit 3 n=1 Tax=Stomoxys calcitrans TaxID=35570 RepID=UPI0027E345BE|nr:dynein regulatory complex subunit 3 [Stomoxys calcitrans]XP_013098385.2 dynein regulatory complex subunit 3 [Stomoxys calcitrans]XP_013098386.2 dynein regulatory complex subunit 3 [Stomoxys calcitrans]